MPRPPGGLACLPVHLGQKLSPYIVGQNGELQWPWWLRPRSSSRWWVWPVCCCDRSVADVSAVPLRNRSSSACWHGLDNPLRTTVCCLMSSFRRACRCLLNARLLGRRLLACCCHKRREPERVLAGPGRGHDLVIVAYDQVHLLRLVWSAPAGLHPISWMAAACCALPCCVMVHAAGSQGPLGCRRRPPSYTLGRPSNIHPAHSTSSVTRC